MRMLLNIKPYSKVWYKDCYYNPLFSAVDYYRGDVTPFFANDVFSFLFHKNKKGFKLVFNNLHQKKDTDLLLHEQGIIIENIDCASGLEKTIKRLITEKKPLIVPIDRFFWTNPINSEHLNTRHDIHQMLVTGYDDNINKYHVIHVDEKNALSDTIDYSELEQVYLAYKGCLFEKYRFDLGAIICSNKTIRPAYTMADYVEQYKKNYLSLRCELYNHLQQILQAVEYYETSFKAEDLFLGDEQYYYFLSLFMLNKGLETELYEITLFLNDKTLINYTNEMIEKVRHIRLIITKLLIRKKNAEQEIKKMNDNLLEIYTIRKSFYDYLFSII